MYADAERGAGIAVRKGAGIKCRLAAIVHLVQRLLRVGAHGEGLQRAAVRLDREPQLTGAGLEERRVEQPARVVDVSLFLVAAADVEGRGGREPDAEASATLSGGVAARHLGAVAGRVVVAPAPGAAHGVGDASVAAHDEPGGFDALRVGVVAGRDRAGGEAGRRVVAPLIDANGAEVARAPRQRVRALHDLHALDAAGVEVTELGIHPERPGGKGAHPIDVDAHLRAGEAADVGVEAERSAPNGVDSGKAAQKPTRIGGVGLADLPVGKLLGGLEVGPEGRHLHAPHLDGGGAKRERNAGRLPG